MTIITNFIYRPCSIPFIAKPAQEAPTSSLLIDSIAKNPSQHEISALKPGIPVLRNQAFFTGYLRQLNFKHAFSSTKYDKNLFNPSYNKTLLQFRSDVKKYNSQDLGSIAQKIITAPLLLPGVAVLSKILDFQSPSKLPLSEQLQADRISIKKAPFSKWNLFEGPIHRAFRKLGSVLNIFDPHRSGNLPFLVGHRCLNGKKVTVLRHSVPTVENGPYSVEISGEYKAFLSECRKKGQKLLYCCLLNPNNSNEIRRIAQLKKLSEEEKETFHFIRIPLDGVLSKDRPSESLQEYVARVKESLKASVANQSTWKEEFLFSPAVASVVKDSYENAIDCAAKQIQETYANNPSAEDLKESKQAFFLLFSSLLRHRLIHRLDIDYYNNSCKDGIDRGAVHLMTDLILDSFLTGRLKENRTALRVLAAWPAFMAKTQPILTKRFKWIESFARWIEKAEKQNRSETIALACLTSLSLIVSKGVDFDNRHITLMA